MNYLRATVDKGIIIRARCFLHIQASKMIFHKHILTNKKVMLSLFNDLKSQFTKTVEKPNSTTLNFSLSSYTRVRDQLIIIGK